MNPPPHASWPPCRVACGCMGERTRACACMGLSLACIWVQQHATPCACSLLPMRACAASPCTPPLMLAWSSTGRLHANGRSKVPPVACISPPLLPCPPFAHHFNRLTVTHAQPLLLLFCFCSTPASVPPLHPPDVHTVPPFPHCWALPFPCHLIHTTCACGVLSCAGPFLPCAAHPLQCAALSWLLHALRCPSPAVCWSRTTSGPLHCADPYLHCAGPPV